MNIFRKMTFICGLFVLLSACGIGEMVTFENSEYLDVINSKSKSELLIANYKLNGSVYMVTTKEFGYNSYDIWLIKLGLSAADNKVVIDRVLIKLANRTASHVLAAPVFSKGLDGNQELLLGSIDFNQEPFKSVSTQSPLYVHVTFKVDGVKQTKIYILNRVVQKMVIYPT